MIQIVLLMLWICAVMCLRKWSELAEAEWEMVRRSELTRRAIDSLTGMVDGFQQIRQTGRCGISPVTIRVTYVDIFLADLSVEGTVLKIPTEPFYDLEQQPAIAMGYEKPRHTLIDEADIHDMEAGKAAIQNDPALFDAALRKILDTIAAQSREAIYPLLFGVNKTCFPREIDEYDLTVSQYPVGDVTIKCDDIFLETGRYGAYRKTFYYIYSTLKKKYPSAFVTLLDQTITVAL